MQEALNVSQLRWRQIVYDYIDDLKRLAGEGSEQLHSTFNKIAQAGPDFELCAPEAGT